MKWVIVFERLLKQREGYLPSCAHICQLSLIDIHYVSRYDVSGVHPDKIQRVLEQDWMHLVRDKCILDSPNYLREKGSPVIALWGMRSDPNHFDCLVHLPPQVLDSTKETTPLKSYDLSLISFVPPHQAVLILWQVYLDTGAHRHLIVTQTPISCESGQKSLMH